MNPIFDLKGEHDAIQVVLSAMKKLSSDIRRNKQIDLFRIAQILEFLQTYIDHSHHDKEEEIFFPALTNCTTPGIADTIHLLMDEHIIARGYRKEIEIKLCDYVGGHANALEGLASNMLSYIALEENHIRLENQALLPVAERFLNKTKLDCISSEFKHIQNREIRQSKHLEYYLLLRKLYEETSVTQVRKFAY